MDIAEHQDQRAENAGADGGGLDLQTWVPTNVPTPLKQMVLRCRHSVLTELGFLRVLICERDRISHLFFAHPFFLFFLSSSTLPFAQAIFFPKIPCWTSDLLFLVEKRQLAGAGFSEDSSGRGRSRGKKEHPFFLAREKR